MKTKRSPVSRKRDQPVPIPVVPPEPPPSPLWELTAMLLPDLDGSDSRTMTLLSLVAELDGTRRPLKTLAEVVQQRLKAVRKAAEKEAAHCKNLEAELREWVRKRNHK